MTGSEVKRYRYVDSDDNGHKCHGTSLRARSNRIFRSDRAPLERKPWEIVSKSRGVIDAGLRVDNRSVSVRQRMRLDKSVSQKL